MWFASYLPHFYFKSGIIDPIYNLFTFLGVYSLIRCRWDSRVGKRTSWKWVLVAGFFTGLAILTKGPVAFGIILLVILGHALFSGFRLPVRPGHLLLFIVLPLAVSAIWLGLQYVAGDTESARQFIHYQWRLFSNPASGHVGFPGYHLVMLLIGCFPASVLAFGVIGVKRSHRQTRADFAKWMHVLLVVVVLVFSLVQTKIVHYSSLAYYPITFLAALTVYRAYMGRRFNRGLKISLGITMGLAACGLLAVPFIMSLPEWLSGISGDAFTQAVLAADVKWSTGTYIPGVLLALLTVTTILLWVRRLRKAWIYVFLGTMCFVVMSSIFVFAPKVEEYAQRPAVNFFKQLEGKEAYVVCYRYKSYAHYFYAKVDYPWLDSWIPDDAGLLNDQIDKDVYISSRVDHADELRDRLDMEELGREGGFVFFRRARPGEAI
jgi:4-amino-4-deoxy-L-arabinose transferase-like glycosyltransferase